MFHDGDLTSGISLAISQSKMVAILVRTPDNSEANEAYDSRIWEEYWLQNLDSTWDETNGPPFGEQIREKAVLLRIDIGSQEAQFLSAFCPITAAPTFVVIKDGKVLERLEAGVTREQFVYRVGKAVGLRVAEPSIPASTSPLQEEPITIASQTHSIASSISPTAASAAMHNSSDLEHEHAADQGPSESTNSARLRAVMQERSQKLEADKAARDAAEKEARVERARARRKEAEEAGSNPASNSSAPSTSSSKPKSDNARRDWLQQQNQRKQEAKVERERILRQIEIDKQERKARQQRAQASPSDVPEQILRTSGAAATASSIHNHSGQCSLQVRLFDGSSIRSRFPSDAKLATEVRNWITESTKDTAGQSDTPFVFRHNLAPQPSRTIEISEEHQSLRDLGLLPGATLILQPVIGAADAYAGAGGSGLLGYAYRGASSLLGAVGQYLPAFPRNANPLAEHAQPAQMTSPATTTTAQRPVTPNVRVQTLADQRKDQPSEFYNGNSLGFQGRDDGRDDKDT